MDIRGHAAIVTGGASGLGAATARMLAEAGAKVAIFDVNQKAAAEVAIDINGIALACDVTDSAATEKAVAAAAADHGTARIVINCAGVGPAKRIVGRDGPMPLAEFARVVEINLVGTFNVMRLAAAAMQSLEPLQDGERGIIVCTASVAAYEGQIGQAAYAASKGGVVGLDHAGGARIRAVRHPRQRHRTGHILHPDAACAAGSGAAEPGGVGAVSEAARPAAAICRAGAPHDREPLPQRRSGAARRRAAHGAALIAAMLTNTRTVRIEWGDCDPAGIIFYPRYFDDIRHLDDRCCIERATRHEEDRVSQGLRFRRPSGGRDARAISPAHPVRRRSRDREPVVACGRSSFKIEHRLTLAGTLAAEGFETRVWAGRDPDDPQTHTSQPIPAEVVARLTHGADCRRRFPAARKCARSLTAKRKETLMSMRVDAYTHFFRGTILHQAQRSRRRL